MQIEKRRLALKMSVSLWRKSLIDNGLKEVDLTGDMAIYSANLSNFHGDPADLVIVAAANSLTAILCTADEKILGCDLSLMRLDARK